MFLSTDHPHAIFAKPRIRYMQCKWHLIWDPIGLTGVLKYIKNCIKWMFFFFFWYINYFHTKQLLEDERKLMHIIQSKAFLFKLDHALLLKYVCIYILVSSSCTWSKARNFVTFVVYVKIRMVNVDISEYLFANIYFNRQYLKKAAKAT
jgi:hypothetical protein